MKKNILLVMPKVPYSINDWNLPPIGIVYISSFLKQKGFNIFTLNLTIEKGTIKDIMSDIIQKRNIDIIATGDLVVNYKQLKEIIDLSKLIKNDIITIIGGGFVTHSPKEAMSIINNADFGVIGEGEITMNKLLSAIENDEDYSKIKGIVYRDNNKIMSNDYGDEVENLDEIPFPDYEGFKIFDVIKCFSKEDNVSIGITTSRSCPFKCTFCSSSGGKKYRQRSLNNIFSEIEYLVKKCKINEIFLNDELFAVNSDRVYEFCKNIKKYNIKWHVMLRISKHIEKNLLIEMNESGCIGVCYGLESADNNVLKSMNKGIDVNEITRVLKITNEAGLKVRGGFIFGDSAETSNTVKKTMGWIEDHINLLENVSISPIVLYPGSSLYNKAVANGLIKNTVEFIKSGCPLVNISDNLTEFEYQNLVNYDIPFFAARIRYSIANKYKEKLEEKLLSDSQFYLHQFKCDCCKNYVERIINTNMMFQSHFVCKHCNAKYDFFPNFLYFQTFKDEINKLLRKNNVAIWGAGETLQDLYICNDYLAEKNIIIIDSNKFKQKNGFKDSKIYDPDYISKSELDTIICCVGNVNYIELKNYIEKKYNKIKRIIWIYEIGLK